MINNRHNKYDEVKRAWWCFGTTDSTMEEREYIIGEHDVDKIYYHEPLGDGDRHYVDVIFHNGDQIRAFNPTEIGF